MARMTFSVQLLLDAMSREAGGRARSAEVLAVDNAKGTVTLDVRGHGTPEKGEVEPVFHRHQPAVPVECKPVARDPSKAEGWPSWAPQD